MGSDFNFNIAIKQNPNLMKQVNFFLQNIYIKNLYKFSDLSYNQIKRVFTIIGTGQRVWLHKNKEKEKKKQEKKLNLFVA